jgi:hypothetical protein
MSSATELARRLESGEIITFDPCPFALPAHDDHAFLLAQELNAGKDINYNPHTRAVAGHVIQSDAATSRLAMLMEAFSTSATSWLRTLLPAYAGAWQLDRVSLRTEEEATRTLRLTARNDLLHFDAFPSRPTQGHRILRLYVNIHPTDERIWTTSETFAKVLEKYGAAVGLPGIYADTILHRVGQKLLGIFQPTEQTRTEYDGFMLRLHHFMKLNEEFQEHAPRKLLRFKAGSAWLLFADAISHAELRGQFALEHSFFIAPESLALPDQSPAALLERVSRAVPPSQAA